MKKTLDILKRIGGTVMLPVIMYGIMKILCGVNGKPYLANWKMWMVIIPQVAVTVACAMGMKPEEVKKVPRKSVQAWSSHTTEVLSLRRREPHSRHTRMAG